MGTRAEPAPSAPPTRRPPRHGPGPRRWAAAAVLLLVPVGLSISCSDNPSGEAGFLSGVREAYPELSNADVSDADLVDLARDTCSPTGLSATQQARLQDLGVGRDRFEELAQDLCPSR